MKDLPHWKLLLLLACIHLGACRSTGADDGARTNGISGPIAAPWTGAFLKPAGLTAAKIWIEGPRGLAEHLAMRQDDSIAVYSEKTVPQGFLRTLRSKGTGWTELHAQIDQWELVAFEELRVLERFGAADIRIRASGDVFWQSEGEESRRGENLEFNFGVGPP